MKHARLIALPPLLAASPAALAAGADLAAGTGLVATVGVLFGAAAGLWLGRRRRERDNDARWQMARASALLGWFEYDPKSGQVMSEAETLLGLDKSWRTTSLERWLARVHPDDLPAVAALTEAGAEHRLEFRIRHADDHWEWLSVHASLVGGAPDDDRLFGVCQVITQKKLAEAELVRREQHFRALVDNAADIVSRFDLELKCRFVNRAVNRYTPLPREEMIGHRIGENGWPADAAAQFETECRRLIDTWEGRRFEVEFESAQRRHVFEVRLLPEFDAEQRLVSILSLQREITETRQTQRLLEEENIVLEMIANNRPLPEVLTQLCRMIESQLNAGRCAVMLRDKGREVLTLAAAPSLPSGFAHALREVPVGPDEPNCGGAAYWQRTTIVADVDAGTLPTRYRELAQQFGIRACWSVPVMTNEQHLIGTIAAYYAEPRSPSPDEMRFVYRASRIAAIALERDRHEKRLYHEATRDVLTNAYNRRHFLELAVREHKRSRRYDSPLSLLLVDMDHFKAINDEFGHPAGDEVLRAFTRLARQALRGSDVLGRLGGEEFAVLLPNTPLDEAHQVAERLRDAAEADAVDWQGAPIRYTLSVGVSTLFGADSIDDMLARADRWLYTVKRDGRNRCDGERAGLRDPADAVR
ncbi:sensor domain-containing diguanylate cyclase [Crenobacter cavernae]|uniref:diguanylate cyclase n=1 Tax=Crenobacter cavernae TaxID=2290923 RepID=A0ABY0FFZ7_9NEIS|nr:diguanylate cyclase [Crenobacter cavernae]RXZ43726.1 diguanylate cyclase [Crenobacter cavernae]